MWSLGLKSASVLGIAGCCPFAKLGTACGNVSPKSGFFLRLRYRVHQLVSTLSCMMLVRRPICWAPVALLLGSVRNGSRLTTSAPFEARYALMKVSWVSSSSVLSWMRHVTVEHLKSSGVHR